MSTRRERRSPTVPAPSPGRRVTSRLVALALLLAACRASPPVVAPTPAPTHELGALSVTALLDLSGARAPSGATQRDALQLWLAQPGSRPPPGRLRVVDRTGRAAPAVLGL